MLVIDPSSPLRPYEQLRQQFRSAIESGELEAGAKLPTVRRLAGDLGVAPNTAARTYLELERAGLIETRGRQGTFVADAARSASAPIPQAASRAAEVYVQAIRRLRLDDATAVQLVRATLGG